MAEKISDIIQTVINHGGSFETAAPSEHVYILGKSHRSQHFGSENARVSDFNPSLESRVESEYFKTGFSVRIVSRFVFQLVNTNFFEEFLHDS